MGSLQRVRSWVMGACCIAVLVCFSMPAEASSAGCAMQPGMTRMLLALAGVETEPIVLSGEKSINRAIYIPNLRGYDILIGYPDSGIKRGAPFLLAVNGEELVVTVSREGYLAVIEGDPSVVPTDIADFIECLVNNIVDLARAILQLDIGGIIGNVFQLVGCIFSIL